MPKNVYTQPISGGVTYVIDDSGSVLACTIANTGASGNIYVTGSVGIKIGVGTATPTYTNSTQITIPPGDSLELAAGSQLNFTITSDGGASGALVIVI